MRNRLTLIILIYNLVIICSFTQEKSRDEQLRDLVARNRQAEVSISDPGKIVMETLTRNTSVISLRDRMVHIMLSPSTVEWFISRGYYYSVIERPETKGALGSVNVKQAMQWETYPSYPQYDSIMRFLASEYPLLCRLDTIGTSIRGKLVMALKISDNCSQNETEPEVFYSSTIHGNETGGFVLMLRLADYLLKNYETDTRVRNLVDNLEIWINPLANPDGTYYNGDLIVSPVRNNSNDYDLNRNFPDPITPNTVKQKETIDMMRFLEKHRFVLSANFHSGEEVVNYPWDRWAREHADRDWFNMISRAYADTVHMNSIAGYMDYLENGVTNGYDWYPLYGGRQDYVTYDLQGREVTIELDNNFVTPPTALDALWEYNRRSLIGYFENAARGIAGVVKDAVSGKPVPAMIFIEGHDKDNSQVFTDSLTGEFVRLLKPGIWDLTFTAEGYRDTVLTGVVLNAGEGTSLLVEMVKDLNNTDIPVLFPNPASVFIKAMLPEVMNGEINIKIYSTKGIKLSDYDETVFSGTPVLLDVRRLAAGAYSVVFTNRGAGLSYKNRIVVTRSP